MAFDQFSKEELQNIVSSSITFAEVFRKIGFANQRYDSLLKRLNDDGIDYSHIPRGLHANRGRVFFVQKRVDFNDLFCDNSKHARIIARKRILKDKLIPYICNMCGIGPIWNNKKLTLRLDHKNGKRNDHRLENLRFLCPNCDSQSDTYGGRNIKWPEKAKKYCECGSEVKTSNSCPSCAMIKRRKCERPTKEILEKMVLEFPITEIAKNYGVSDKSVSKWCRKYNIKTFGPGYWTKRKFTSKITNI